MTLQNSFKKKSLATVALLGATAMLLVGCTQEGTTNSADRIEDRQVETMPEWDVRELEAGTWFNGGASNAEEVGNPEQIPGLTDDVFLNNWVTLLDDETSCRITGRILHAPSSMAGRGDDFNSRDYLYSMVPFESELGEVSVTEISEVPFVEMNHYTAPSEEGEAGWHHRAAARVFSGVLDIEGMTLEGDSSGAHGSSLLQGVPVAFIDFSCKDEANLTEERWVAGLENFKLLFENPSEGPSEDGNTGEPVPAPEESVTPTVDGETPAESEAPAEGETAESEAPAEGEESTEAPAETPVETEGASTEGN